MTLASGVPGAKLKRWKVGCTNKTTAKQHEALIRSKLLSGTLSSERVQDSSMTLGQWAGVYTAIEEVRAIRTYRERCQRIQRTLVPFFGAHTQLQEITVSQVEAFRQARGKGRSLSTVNVDHNILKHMLKHAMKRDLLTRNVACLVASPKPKNARDRVLTQDEWLRLYAGAPAWFQPVLLTGYHTGMRLEEILTLTWDRVELEKGRIFLPGALTKTKQDRSVPMTPSLRREYQSLRQQDGIVRISGLVFQKNGKKFTHTYRVVQRICKTQSIENFIFHDLRHCAVTNLADAGVDTETIMKIVGHSSVEMFLRYRTIKVEKLDDAMSRLNTLITRRSPTSSQALNIVTV
jgi:integrase